MLESLLNKIVLTVVSISQDHALYFLPRKTNLLTLRALSVMPEVQDCIYLMCSFFHANLASPVLCFCNNDKSTDLVEVMVFLRIYTPEMPNIPSTSVSASVWHDSDSLVLYMQCVIGVLKSVAACLAGCCLRHICHYLGEEFCVMIWVFHVKLVELWFDYFPHVLHI